MIIKLQNTKIEKLIILGAGASGATAAIIAGQASLNPLVVQDIDCETQMALIHEIDNYPGVLEKIDGIELLNKFRRQAQHFGARFEKGSIIKANLLSRPFRLDFANGKAVYTDALIIASGTKKTWLGLSGETELKGKGVTGAAFCKDTDFIDKTVIVVGGGRAALQEAHHVSDRAARIILLNQSDRFYASQFHQQLVFDNEKIDIYYHMSVENILNVSKGFVTGVVVRNHKTDEQIVIPADVVLVAIGSTPNSELFRDQLELAPSGKIRIHGKNTSTNIPGVFAAGDVTDVACGRVAIASGAGAAAALDAIDYLDSLT